METVESTQLAAPARIARAPAKREGVASANRPRGAPAQRVHPARRRDVLVRRALLLNVKVGAAAVAAVAAVGDRGAAHHRVSVARPQRVELLHLDHGGPPPPQRRAVVRQLEPRVLPLGAGRLVRHGAQVGDGDAAAARAQPHARGVHHQPERGARVRVK
eukprot:4314820-Pleurochrysis_carterae.AAC.2